MPASAWPAIPAATSARKEVAIAALTSTLVQRLGAGHGCTACFGASMSNLARNRPRRLARAPTPIRGQHRIGRLLVDHGPVIAEASDIAQRWERCAPSGDGFGIRVGQTQNADVNDLCQPGPVAPGNHAAADEAHPHVRHARFSRRNPLVNTQRRARHRSHARVRLAARHRPRIDRRQGAPLPIGQRPSRCLSCGRSPIVRRGVGVMSPGPSVWQRPRHRRSLAAARVRADDS